MSLCMMVAKGAYLEQSITLQTMVIDRKAKKIGSDVAL